MSESGPSEQDALLVKPAFALSWDLWLLASIPTAKLAACAGCVKLGAIPSVDVHLLSGILLLCYGAYLSWQYEINMGMKCWPARTAACSMLTCSTCYLVWFVHLQENLNRWCVSGPKGATCLLHAPSGPALAHATAMPLAVLALAMVCGEVVPKLFWCTLAAGLLSVAGAMFRNAAGITCLMLTFPCFFVAQQDLQRLELVEKSLLCPSAVAVVHSANHTLSVRLLEGAAPEAFWFGRGFFSVPASSLVEGGLALWQQRFFAKVWFWRSGWSQLAVPARVFVEMQADGQAQQPDGQGGAAASFTAEQADRLVRERLNQAFSSVFGKLIESSECAAAAAEKQANVVKRDNLVKGLKCDQWKPQTREEELKTWREWYFGFTNYIASHDPEYEADLNGLDWEKEATHALMTGEQVARSRRLYGLLCSLLRGRPLMLIKACEKSKGGYEAIRILKNEMEPREKARTLALLRQLASWRFDEKTTMHEQLVRMWLTGLKEPLRSQVQLKMANDTKYADVREWILQYESLTTPWGFLVPSKGSPPNQDVPQPMDVDVIKGKGKDKGKKGKDKGKKGKDGKGKGKDAKGRPGDGKVLADGNKEADGAAAKGGAGKDTDVCNLCGQRGHWKWECPTKGKNKGKINQVDVQPPASSAASTLTSASTTLPSASQYRGSVNRVEAFRCENPPGCQITQVYDISELEDEGEFSLQGAEVVAIFAASPESVYEEEWFPDVATQDCHEALEYASGAQVFAMDVTDGDGEWAEELDVVIDSGADVSVAPLRFGSFGTAAPSAGVVMQDAQGHRIAQHGSRVLDLDVGTLEGGKVTIREKFAIAKIEAVIVSLGRLMRQDWLRRNTLTMMAVTVGTSASESARLAGKPGWHILGNGLPILVANAVEELDLEKLIWQSASQRPEHMDSTSHSEHELDAELTGRRDVIVLFHVEELPRNLLTQPAGILDAADQENTDLYLPEGEDVGGGAGVGEDAEEVIVEGEPIAEEPHGDDELEGVRLHEHHEVLSRQLSGEIAKKMYMENERPPDMPKIPILPSTRQQELHNITHHPFQSWCEACVVGRSKQSPHKSAEVSKEQEVKAHSRATPRREPCGNNGQVPEIYQPELG
eukprot:s4767_g6.t1